MKHLLQIAFLGIAATGCASADLLCASATLDTYLTAGFTCQLDGVDFGNFSYAGTAATDPFFGVPPYSVNVVVDPNGSLSTLSFQAAWQVFVSGPNPVGDNIASFSPRGTGTGPGPAPPSSSALSFSYTVQSLLPLPIASLTDMSTTDTGGNGSVLQSAMCGEPCTTSANYQNSTLSLAAPTTSQFSIQDSYTLAGGSNGYAKLSSITDEIGVAPEPRGIVLALGGLLMLAAARRRTR
jgi:hypothetical protein